VRQNHNHHMISTGASIGMRKSVLVVAQQIELRARIARTLQSAGYAVELEESQKRALELASGGQIEAAIVVDLPGLAQETSYFPIPDVLTPREREIATLASAGLSNKQIARQSSLVEGTVKIHLHNIYRKLGVKNRTALAALLNGYRLDWTNSSSTVSEFRDDG
jgi:DNA-binding NarL/FixJ family response regulator